MHAKDTMKYKLSPKLVILGIGILIIGICIGSGFSEVMHIFFTPKVTHSYAAKAIYLNAEKEPNDTFAKANIIVPGFETMGTFSNVGDVDMYKFSIDNPATVKISLSNVPTKYSMFVYNENHESVAFADRNGFTRSTSMISLPESGTYYIKMTESAEDKQINTPYTIIIDILPFAD